MGTAGTFVISSARMEYKTVPAYFFFFFLMNNLKKKAWQAGGTA